MIPLKINFLLLPPHFKIIITFSCTSKEKSLCIVFLGAYSVSLVFTSGGLHNLGICQRDSNKLQIRFQKLVST